ncbi:FAD-binding oxidoreductase [Burkholderiaceae bacterium FT117]|uniref:FAD-binding oxidoreductase n=1 Tax=Zeimonas sediminis TaxID=2944268 RepID=UPI002342FF91|nr:FAD-binding oxidoreductase [Zeimonas sediminis]MCM5570601.1 FAD-binding oxidoreductase [Zeimonas sediminis]
MGTEPMAAGGAAHEARLGQPARQAHQARLARVLADLRGDGAGQAAPLGLSKRTSNLFRDRAAGPKRRLDLGEFTNVLGIDPAAGWVDVEGTIRYEALVDATLPHGVMPAVVPQLKTITAGGAAAGVGIEATSFRQGLVHDTLLDFDVLLPDGRIVACSPDNEHRDLFFGFPNSYGTLGYAIRLKLRTIPVRPFVRVEHRRHPTPVAFFDDLARQCEGDADFVDGVVFSGKEAVLSVGRFVDEAPWTSDYGYERIYWRSLRARDTDYLSTHDYIWRWDTDWFWCSRNLGAQNPIVRRLLGRKRLNSRFYTRVMRLNSRLGLTRGLARLRGRFTESVIQDVDVPLDRAGEFLDFLLREIGILPVWTCPIRPADGAHRHALYPLEPGVRYVNFGFWDVVETDAPREAGHFNRLVEREVMRLGGIKSLYSDSFFTREEFDRAYGTRDYAALKARYDPQGRMLGLYEKCVLRA